MHFNQILYDGYEDDPRGDPFFLGVLVGITPLQSELIGGLQNIMRVVLGPSAITYKSRVVEDLNSHHWRFESTSFTAVSSSFRHAIHSATVSAQSTSQWFLYICHDRVGWDRTYDFGCSRIHSCLESVYYGLRLPDCSQSFFFFFAFSYKVDMFHHKGPIPKVCQWSGIHAHAVLTFKMFVEKKKKCSQTVFEPASLKALLLITLLTILSFHAVYLKCKNIKGLKQDSNPRQLRKWLTH